METCSQVREKPQMTMQVLAAVAEFERDLLIERTQSGIARAKSEGKHCGRKATFTEKVQSDICAN